MREVKPGKGRWWEYICKDCGRRWIGNPWYYCSSCGGLGKLNYIKLDSWIY